MIILDQLEACVYECIFVGDSGVDVKTAENSKMDFIGVSWGFWGRKRLEDSGADIIIDDPKEFIDLIN